MRTVRRLAALTTALAAALAVLVWGAPQALAGGPTSALVVSPESKQSASLYFTDKEYAQLSRLLSEPGRGKTEPAPGLAVGSGRQLNVTWLLHDVQTWRVDRVYPDTAGIKDVWIHTSTGMPQSTQMPPNLTGFWHKARHPAELRTLLHKLGVMGKAASGGAAPIFPPTGSAEASAAADPEGVSTAPSPSAATTHGDGSDWWWAIPGLLAGAALALLLRPLVIRLPQTVAASVRRRTDTGPRQELRDV